MKVCRACVAYGSQWRRKATRSEPVRPGAKWSPTQRTPSCRRHAARRAREHRDGAERGGRRRPERNRRVGVQQEAERWRPPGAAATARQSFTTKVDATPRERPRVPRRVKGVRAAREEHGHVSVVVDLRRQVLGGGGEEAWARVDRHACGVRVAVQRRLKRAAEVVVAVARPRQVREVHAQQHEVEDDRRAEQRHGSLPARAASARGASGARRRCSRARGGSEGRASRASSAPSHICTAARRRAPVRSPRAAARRAA